MTEAQKLAPQLYKRPPFTFRPAIVAIAWEIESMQAILIRD